MRGGISLSQSMSYGTLTNLAQQRDLLLVYQYQCYVAYFPTIYVANEFPKGTCKIMQFWRMSIAMRLLIVRLLINMLWLSGRLWKRKCGAGMCMGLFPLSPTGGVRKAAEKQTAGHPTKYSEIINEERRSRQQKPSIICREYENVNTLCRSGKTTAARRTSSRV